jgi:hypothetical protein
MCHVKAILLIFAVAQAPADSATLSGRVVDRGGKPVPGNWAVVLVEALPDDPDLNTQSLQNSARLAVATVLGWAADQRFRKLQFSLLLLWVPDFEDNNPDE